MIVTLELSSEEIVTLTKLLQIRKSHFDRLKIENKFPTRIAEKYAESILQVRDILGITGKGYYDD